MEPDGNVNDTRVQTQVSKPIHIVHVLARFTFGGTELNTLRLVNALTDRGYDQTVISLTGLVDERLRSKMLANLICPQSPAHSPISVFALSRLFEEQAADVVHGRTFGTWLDCCVAARMARRPIKLVQSFHGSTSFDRQVLKRRIMAMFLRGTTDAFVSVSNHLAQRLTQQWGISSEKVRIIQNGVDSIKFGETAARQKRKSALGIDESTFVIGSVGSLLKVKNHRLLIDAFAEFAQTTPNVLLLLLGDGIMRSELEQQSRSLGVADRVKFFGYQSDVQSFLAAMDLYVHPSLTEGSPTAVLEAMAGGLPTVATPSAGCAELHDRHGLPRLVDQDSSSMARVLRELHADPQQRQHLAQQGRELIQRCFTFERMLDEYDQLYQELLQPHAAISVQSLPA